MPCRGHGIIKAGPAVSNQLTAADGWATNQITAIRLKRHDLIVPPSTQHAEPNASEGLLAQCEETEPGVQGREAPKHVPGDAERRGEKTKFKGGGDVLGRKVVRREWEMYFKIV